jgi:EpsI family protein
VRTIAIAIAMLMVVALTRITAPVVASTPPVLDAIPMALGEWNGAPAPPIDPETARVLAADQYVHRIYAGPGGNIEMDVAYYAQPRVGSNMHSPLNCLPGNGWQITDVRDLQLSVDRRTWPVRDTLVERRGQKYALTYWFQSRSRIVSSEWSNRVHLLGDALRRRRVDAAIVRLFTPATGDASAERNAIVSFASVVIPAVGERLQ